MKIDSRTVACTAAAMVAFAGNSVLTRLALGRATIDAATFSTVRIAGGAGMLLATTALRESGRVRLKGSWVSAAVLFLYAIPFSFAYSSLTAGTGALILFGVVQVTMMVAAVRTGERPHWLQWIGLALASCGLVYLVVAWLEGAVTVRFPVDGARRHHVGHLLASWTRLGGPAAAEHEQLRAGASAGDRRQSPRAQPRLCNVEWTLARARVRGNYVWTGVRAVVHGTPTSHRHARGHRATDGADPRGRRRRRVSRRDHFVPSRARPERSSWEASRWR